MKALDGHEHVIWDWNGTLLDDVGHAVNTINRLLSDYHLPLITRNHYRQIFDFPVIKYYERLGFDFNRHSFEDVCEQFVESFMSGFHNLPLVPEMRFVLFDLHQKQVAQSVLSATDQQNLDSMMNHYDLNSLFKFVYGIDNKQAASKLKRGEELIEASGFCRTKTVLIGDTLHDLEVAQKLGINSILISHGHQCPTRLRQHHDLVIEV